MLFEFQNKIQMRRKPELVDFLLLLKEPVEFDFCGLKLGIKILFRLSDFFIKFSIPLTIIRTFPSGADS